MSFSVNHIVLEGNIGGDVKADFPEDGEVTIAKFSVAQFVGAKHKQTGKYVPRWRNIRVRSKTSTDPNNPSAAQFCIDNLKKGDAVIVTGRMSGFIPDEEYEKEARDSSYKAAPVDYIDALEVRKLEKTKREGGGSTNREEMPPF